MTYRVEKDWESHGLRCVVVMTGMGHRCGYVGVSKDHSLFKIEYNEEIPVNLKKRWEDIQNEPIGKRGVVDLFMMSMKDEPRVGYIFDVHGGITYSTSSDKFPSKYPVESDLWWFGYDCAHAGDGKDLSEVDEKTRAIFVSMNEIVRSLDYCVAECESLAEQLEAVK